MSGDLLDVVLLVACVVFAISGYRQGFVIGVLSFVGFLGGGVVGAKVAPTLAGHFDTPTTQALVAIVVVFLLASLGQLGASLVGGAIRDRLLWRPLRALDSVAGAVVSVVSVLAVAWLVGTAVAHSPFQTLRRQVSDSTVLQHVDDVMPDIARSSFAAFRRLVDANGFPQVFSGLGAERIVPVDPPDPALAGSAVVTRVRPSVVKVIGTASSCQRSIEGSGFVYAPGRVMTNAHVVAGVDRPRVLPTGSGRSLAATVVLYDPRRDIAVLSVPGLDAAPLAFGGRASRGDSAIVVGYPQNGPFTPVAARVRSVQDARGPDIYQRSQVTREIYSLYSRVLPGNSGGPLLSPDGKVYGVVFAAAVDDPSTGYALTAAEVASDAAAGRTASGPVGTGGCD